jgi:hypothetical protein
MTTIERAIKRGDDLVSTFIQLKAAGCTNEDIQNALAEMKDKERRRKAVASC